MKTTKSLFALASLWLAAPAVARIESRDDTTSCSNPVSIALTNVTFGDSVIQFETLSCNTLVHANVIQTSGLGQPFGQCGGQDFAGPTVCVSGFFCEFFNPFFSQCVPLPTTSVKATTVKTTAAPPSTVSSAPPSVPTPPPATDVCDQLCSNTCGSLGDLPPISEDCATIFDSINILSGSIAPTFSVPPNSVQQLTFGTCRVFFENLSTSQTLTSCWTALATTASAAGTLCFPPTQPVKSLGLCTANSGIWAVGIAHS